jgi:prepilin peptidase CpaA
MLNKADFLPATTWLTANLNLIIPLLLSLWMAWGDIKTRRIPNYLTLGTALAGLGFQTGMHGWAGLASGLGGMALGFGLLIGFYILGGIGAGDVKGLAALGAWLGPQKTFELFIGMAIFGGVLSVALLWWRGQLWSTLGQGLIALKNWFFNYILLRPHRSLKRQPAANPAASSAGGIPYAVALAAGMATLLVRNLWPGS